MIWNFKLYSQIMSLWDRFLSEIQLCQRFGALENPYYAWGIGVGGYSKTHIIFLK